MVGSERPEEHAVVVAAMQTTQQILDSINKVSEPAMEDIQFTFNLWPKTRNIYWRYRRMYTKFLADFHYCKTEIVIHWKQDFHFGNLREIQSRFSGGDNFFFGEGNF